MILMPFYYISSDGEIPFVMNFIAELFIISLGGGIVAMDTTASWQFMISQPLVACTAIGFVLGNPSLGLLMGILLQLPWLLEIPAGGAHSSEGNIGSYVSAALAIHFVSHQVNTENIAIVSSILWGLVISWIGGKLVDTMRKSNIRLAHRAERAAESGNDKQITWTNMTGVANAFGLGFFIVIVAFSTGALWYSKIVASIPSYFDQSFGFCKIGILAMGAGCMISMFLTRQSLKYWMIGLMASILIYFLT